LSLDDAICLLEDSGAMSVEELVYAVTDGNYKKITLYASRATEEGVSSIAILRAIQRHLYRLYQTSRAVQSGKNITEAMSDLKPPVFFTFKNRFQKQLGIWTPTLLERALDLLLKTEINCKTGQIPERAVFERSLFRTAQLPKTG
jgi:DNA polymerase III, delta subunit